jgi:hypothetical protein
MTTGSPASAASRTSERCWRACAAVYRFTRVHCTCGTDSSKTPRRPPGAASAAMRLAVVRHPTGQNGSSDPGPRPRPRREPLPAPYSARRVCSQKRSRCSYL